MNLGLGSLTDLKQFLLPAAQRLEDTWDDALSRIGAGVASTFESVCSRKFFRTVDDTFTADAARTVFVAPRYPLEAVSTIELRLDMASSWETLDSSVLINWDAESGLIRLAAPQGPDTALLRFTITGGYWFPDLDNAETSLDLPDGATALPEALRYAWLQQCAHEWGFKDHTGRALSDPESPPRLPNLPLLPAVQSTLRSFTRQAVI